MPELGPKIATRCPERQKRDQKKKLYCIYLWHWLPVDGGVVVTLVTKSQLPPGFVVVVLRNATGHDVPAPFGHHQAEWQERHLHHPIEFDPIEIR